MRRFCVAALAVLLAAAAVHADDGGYASTRMFASDKLLTTTQRKTLVDKLFAAATTMLLDERLEHQRPGDHKLAECGCEWDRVNGFKAEKIHFGNRVGWRCARETHVGGSAFIDSTTPRGAPQKILKTKDHGGLYAPHCGAVCVDGDDDAAARNGTKHVHFCPVGLVTDCALGCAPPVFGVGSSDAASMASQLLAAEKALYGGVVLATPNEWKPSKAEYSGCECDMKQGFLTPDNEPRVGVICGHRKHVGDHLLFDKAKCGVRDSDTNDGRCIAHYGPMRRMTPFCPPGWDRTCSRDGTVCKPAVLPPPTGPTLDARLERLEAAVMLAFTKVPGGVPMPTHQQLVACGCDTSADLDPFVNSRTKRHEGWVCSRLVPTAARKVTWDSKLCGEHAKLCHRSAVHAAGGQTASEHVHFCLPGFLASCTGCMPPFRALSHDEL